MPCWFRLWIAALLLVMPALPLEAQGLSPFEAVYCPASESQRERQCSLTDRTIRRNQDLIATVGAQMSNPGIIPKDEILSNLEQSYSASSNMFGLLRGSDCLH